MNAGMLLAFAALLGLSTMAHAQTDLPRFVPVAAGIHDATLKDLGDESWEIVTTGPDPFLLLKKVAGTVTRERHVLAFEYASPQGTDALQVYASPPLDEAHSLTGPGLSLAEGWTTHSIDLAELFDKMGGKWESLRIDPGNQPGKTIRIRNIVLREPTAREREMVARRETRKAELEARHRRTVDYLSRVYPCAISNVSADASRIEVTGSVGEAQGTLYLAEAPLWADVTALTDPPTLIPIRDRPTFRISAPRMDGQRDRLTSRWAVVRKDAAGLTLQSTARYIDALRQAPDTPEARPRTKKGLGGWWIHSDALTKDLDDLGISAVTVNILLNNLFATTSAPGWSPFTYGGRTYYAHDEAVQGYDRILAEPAKRGIVVSAIVLIAQGYNAPEGSWSRLVAHPDAHPSGIFVMPNMDSQEAVQAYAAAIDFLARRYGRANSPHGRIHHWILHNEINAGWVWTNAGEKTDTLYMDLYHRSMRLVQSIARQYDPHAKAFISLEHHWNETPEPRFYLGKRLLDLLLQYGRAEGDFDWGLAFHPYPDSLLVPRTWEDGHTTFSLDTPKITFRNLEVLDAWAAQKNTWFQGKTPRTIHCTEQGLNSPDYSEKSLREQAAGMAYAWQKLKASKYIEAFQYHAWIDNRGEFGLRIGLRKFADEPGDPYGKKPIWEVYRAMGTPDEDRVLSPYKSVVGVRDWSEVVHKGAIR
jgi:hypothetical protein